MNISRICPHCDHLNAGTEEEQYPCAGCGRQIKQDHNAAMNLARFGADPEPAEMAVAGL
jgi:transposase